MKKQIIPLEKNLVDHQKNNEWFTIPYKQTDLPLIGWFFKELYNGDVDYGSMGFFHWKIIDNYVEPGIINLIKDGEIIASTTSIKPKQLVYKGEVVNIVPCYKIMNWKTGWIYNQIWIF